MATTYWVDTTEMDRLRDDFDAPRLVVGIVMVDNYEDMMNACADTQRSAVLAQIDERLNAWTTGSGGMLRKFDRDRYLFQCDEQSFRRLLDDKFSILESIHQVTSEDGVTASLSIGVGKDCESYSFALAVSVMDCTGCGTCAAACIAKEKAKAQGHLKGIEAKLNNEAFTSKGPAHIVQNQRDQAEKLRALIAQLEQSAAAMGKMAQ